MQRMTFLVVPVFGDRIEEVRARIAQAVEQGADLIEMRLDLMPGISDDQVRTLCREAGPNVRRILTIRSAVEGGQYDGGDDERLSRLIELGPAFDYVDLELETYRCSANIQQKLRMALRRAGHASQADGVEQIESAARRRLILSRHDLRQRPRTMQTDFVAMLDCETCDVPKLAWQARSIRDNFEAFELMRTSPKPAIMICMGEDGLLSRVLAKKFGAFAGFASLSEDATIASGQVPLQTLRRRYRWDAIDAATRVYGVVGDPVGHSLGPVVHNAGFEALGENAVYLPMRVSGSYEAFKAFMVEVTARPWLDFRGLSITIPHKQHASRFVAEHGGRLDATAARVGAINTVLMGQAGSLEGCNTDMPASVDALCLGLDCDAKALAGRRVVVLGAGGVARAVVAGLADAGADVTVFARSEPKAEMLAAAFGCKTGAWTDRPGERAEILVNCTSVGMRPQIDATPIPRERLREGSVVFDAVYNPRRTKLLRDAEDAGCRTIDGQALFLAQACRQFEFWTGRAAPRDALREAMAAAADG